MKNAMTLHLVKLCVGIDTVKQLQASIDTRVQHAIQRGNTPHTSHTTRMVPKRIDELVNGGSLYWVIKGNIQARQKIEAVEPFKDMEGIRRCHIIMDPELVCTEFSPRRAFQGWRYLTDEDAPQDLSGAQMQIDTGSQMYHDLMELRLL